MPHTQTVRLFDMQFITSCISTTMVLILLGMMVFFVLSARSLSVYVRESLNFSILLNADAPEKSILQLQKELDKEAFVKESAYISKEQALREYTEAMGTDRTDLLDDNPFYPSIELRLNAAYANADSIARIEQLIKQDSNVREVSYRKELVNAVNDNIRKISLSLLALAVVLTLISFALINNTIRLTIYSQRFLIHTMKLVGASWGFIRRPFLWRNFWIGVLAALVADGILWAAANWLVAYEPGLVRVVTPRVMLLVSAVVLASGVLITWLCALLSINKYLRMKAGTLYYI